MRAFCIKFLHKAEAKQKAVEALCALRMDVPKVYALLRAHFNHIQVSPPLPLSAVHCTWN